MRSEWSNIEAIALGIMAVALLFLYAGSQLAQLFK
jgi:hypothetical protein